MSETAGIRVRVTPEELTTISGEVEEQVGVMRRLFEEAGEIVNRSSGYWEGEGQSAYVKAFQSGQGQTEEALKRFMDNVTNLRTIAGTYKAAEEAALEASASLSEDVIV